MKRLLLPLALVCSGCAFTPPVDERHGAAQEDLECVRSAGNTVKFGNYKLVFLSRDFRSTVQVWLNPDSGRVVVLKRIDDKVCYVANSLPNMLYMPYDKDAKKIIQASEREQ